MEANQTHEPMPEIDAVSLPFPRKTLGNLTRFVIDMGVDGFNAYKRLEDGTLELFAAGSTPEDFANTTETIANYHAQRETDGADPV